MLPDPIHPAVVHIPIALALVIPLFAVGALLAIRAGHAPRAMWSGVVLLSFILLLGSWVAMESGEADEERVESVVAERYIEAHEHAAEFFIVLAGALAVVALLGTGPGAFGGYARIVTVVLSIALLASATRVGHLGGALVYEHGAAQAHMGGARISPPVSSRDLDRAELRDLDRAELRDLDRASSPDHDRDHDDVDEGEDPS